MSISALIALYCALVLLVAGFAAGETALFALRWWRRRALRRDKRLAPLLDELEKRPGRLLFALLAGSEIAGIAAAMTADGLRHRIVGGAGLGGFFIAAALTGLCTALLGELLPKIYAASRPETVAGRLAAPLKLWLRFAGINYRARIFLDGKRLADERQIVGALAGHELDITAATRRHGAGLVATIDGRSRHAARIVAKPAVGNASRKSIQSSAHTSEISARSKWRSRSSSHASSVATHARIAAARSRWRTSKGVPVTSTASRRR